MASGGEIFDVSGPVHLVTSLDWNNMLHRRSLAASLVQGVYILERERECGSFGQNAHAHPWWERFNFELHQRLVDDSDSSYFGAIFKLKDAHLLLYQSSSLPPKYIIAFRGTIPRLLTKSDDMKLNLKCIFSKLEESSRFGTAFEAVSKTVKAVGATNVWIAGHSLGASIATLAGRNMAKSGHQLEAYLFNPPFITVPIEKMIKNEKLKHGVRFAGSLLTAGIMTAMNHCREDPQQDPFVLLSDWTPYVFVNPSDPICMEYIGYFEHREMMEGIGVGSVERIATKYSIGSLISGAMGKELEPFHLLPTAYMTVNTSPYKDLMEAHGIHQWWQHNFQWQSKLYNFK